MDPQPISTFSGSKDALVYGPSQAGYAGDGPCDDYEWDDPDWHIATYFREGQFRVYLGESVLHIRPTHWLPKPPPPSVTQITSPRA